MQLHLNEDQKLKDRHLDFMSDLRVNSVITQQKYT
jgi:hypothetical protein